MDLKSYVWEDLQKLCDSDVIKKNLAWYKHLKHHYFNPSVVLKTTSFT